MHILWKIGSIVCGLVLFLCYAVFVVGSRRADKYKTKLNKLRHAVDTPIVEEWATEVERKIA